MFYFVIHELTHDSMNLPVVGPEGFYMTPAMKPSISNEYEASEDTAAASKLFDSERFKCIKFSKDYVIQIKKQSFDLFGFSF